MKRTALARGFVPWCAALTIAAAWALVHWPRWPWIAAYFAAVNAVTFVLYGADKALSRCRSAPRVPERTLHLFALAGGTPGALIGQQVFRHKTRKSSFRLMFWLIAALEAGLLGLWLWYSGAWR